MKKVFIGCGLTFLSVVVLLMILFFVYRSFTISDLKKKTDEINEIWISLIATENLKNKKTLNFLETSEIKNSDSLKIYLKDYFKSNDVLECNPDFVYKEYLLNKYFLKIFAPYLKDINLMTDNKVLFEEILNDIDKQNLIIDSYNSNVRDYNTFIGTFPNFIIAKSNGFKMKKYFDVKFGIDNKDPKQTKLETIEWIKKIEKEHGLSE